MRYLPVFMIFMIGCLGPVAELYPDDEDLRPVPVYVVSHGWHVGIAMESSFIRDKLQDHPEMPEAAILKFGWGDNRYYPHSSPGFGFLVRAGLWPTRSVLHVVGIDIPIERYFTNSDIIKIQVSEEGVEELARFIAERFRTDENGRMQFSDEGLYTNSAFFEANGYYYLPKTSNTWTARALRKTGYPITPFYAVTSGNVVRQARKDGEWIQRRE
ncbi:MAG: DUF2459 domain-containing protein [Balneolaceae bacterium]